MKQIESRNTGAPHQAAFPFRKLARNEHTFSWGFSDEGELDCILEFEPECLGRGEHPDYPAVFTLCEAWASTVNVYDLLSAGQIERIESQAANRLAEDAQEAAAEHDFERRSGAYA
jgi:hypothetical protein